MTDALHITYLADYPELVLTLAEWFKAEWPEYYAEQAIENIAKELSEDLNRKQLPIRLIAFLDQELVGTIVLRELAISSQAEYIPGLGGLYVAEPYRKRGIATELVRAGMNLARDLGYPVLYTTTNSARGIVERLHWERMRTIVHHGEEIGLYRYAFTPG